MQKLVRDKIPEIIEKEHWYVDFYVADDKEYRKFLFEKLLEESDEVYDTQTKQELIEEIADLFEVVETILKNENIGLDEVKKVQEEKRKLKWWFKKKFILRKDN